MKIIQSVYSIPIYQCSLQKYISKIRSKSVIVGNPAPGSYVQQVLHLERVCGPWKYNGIVGYLHLYIENNALLVDHWHSIKRTQICSGAKRTININEGQQRIHSVSLLRCNTNHECQGLIFKEIQTLIRLLKNNFRGAAGMKERFFDLSEFEVICKHLDWIGLRSTTCRRAQNVTRQA